MVLVLAVIKLKTNRSHFGRVNLTSTVPGLLLPVPDMKVHQDLVQTIDGVCFPLLAEGGLASLINVDFIDNLKLRGNYGLTGNQPSIVICHCFVLVRKAISGYNEKFGRLMPRLAMLIQILNGKRKVK